MTCHQIIRHFLTGLAVLAFASSAQAVYVDFADYQGHQTGNGASIVADGYPIDISAAPSDFSLTITDAGLGVQCNRSFWQCLTNQSSQIDAEWGEQITITWDEVVSVNTIDLGLHFNGEVAVVGTVEGTTEITGANSYFSSGTTQIDMGGLLVDQITFSAKNIFSDFSVRGIDFTPGGGAGEPGGGGGPASAVPEPSAALVFAAGFGITALHGRRRRSD